jgi:hypothetical protein
MDYTILNTFLILAMLVYVYRTFRQLGRLLAEASTNFERDVKSIKESLQRIESRLK